MEQEFATVGQVPDEELPDRFVHPDYYKIEATNEDLNLPPPVNMNHNNISAY